MLLYLEHILSIPALVYHIENMTPDFLDILQNNQLLNRVLDLLYNDVLLDKISGKLKGTQGLALLGNVINMFHLEPEESAKLMSYPKFAVCIEPAGLCIMQYRFENRSLMFNLKFACANAVRLYENAATNTGCYWCQRWHIYTME